MFFYYEQGEMLLEMLGLAAVTFAAAHVMLSVVHASCI
jgi:hypothetical protein